MDERIKHCFVEMDKLENLLKESKIEYIRDINIKKVLPDLLNGKYAPVRNQIILNRNNRNICSVICHYGSYGVNDGLLDFWDFKNEAQGFLNAKEAFELIKKSLERR